MRNFVLFVMGIAVGLAVEAAVAQNTSPNKGIVGLEQINGIGHRQPSPLPSRWR